MCFIYRQALLVCHPAVLAIRSDFEPARGVTEADDRSRMLNCTRQGGLVSGCEGNQW